MASVMWSIVQPVPRLERISRHIAGWLRLAGGYDVESGNTAAGLMALIALPAAFVASLASSLPLAFPVALATINLSIAGERRSAAKRPGVAELFLASLLLLVAVFFGLLAVNGTAGAAALAGVVLSVTFAALPSILRFLMAKSHDRRAVLSRDIEGLDRLAPDERLVVVERGGRVAAVSRAARRQFAESGLKPGADLLHLIDSLDRPILLNGLDKAAYHEQVISLRLNAEQCPREMGQSRIDLSLTAIDSRTVIVRLQESPPDLPKKERSDRKNRSAARQNESMAGEGACDLEDAVRFAIRILAGDADKQGVRVIMKERPDCDAETVPLVKCPARATRQIALNLIGNAIKFSHAGGLVTIETGIDEESGLLCVRDEGIGIAERDRDALFCPDKRGGGHDRHGCGLGLAIVGDLVAGCDGRISVKSAPGKGTAVTIRLPSASANRQAGRIGPHSPANQSHVIARAA